MSDAPAPSPAAPAPEPAAVTPAAPSPAPAPGDSLLTPPAPPAPAPAPVDAPAPAPADADPWAAVPEKYHVKGEDGVIDQTATLAKLNAGYTNLSKRLGTGDVAPETPEAYTYTPPEQFKDIPLDDALTNGFKAEAHKAGMSQKQYEFVMNKYFELVPQVLNSVANLTKEEARAELGKVWTTPAEFDAGVQAAERALGAAPESLRAQVFERFGRDPLFIQFAASFGKEMREDTPPGGGGSASGADTVQALLASEAYRNPRHPDHAATSEKVRKHFEKSAGTAPAM